MVHCLSHLRSEVLAMLTSIEVSKPTSSKEGPMPRVHDKESPEGSC